MSKTTGINSKRKAAASALVSTSGIIKESRKRSEVKASLQTAVTALSAYADSLLGLREKTFTEERKAARAALNAASGLLDGVLNETPLVEIRKHARSAKPFFAAVASGVVEDSPVEAQKQKKSKKSEINVALSAAPSYKEALEILRGVLDQAIEDEPKAAKGEDEAPLFDPGAQLDGRYRINPDAIRSNLEALEGFQKKIPTSLPPSHPYKVVRVPVIPIFKTNPNLNARTDYSVQRNFSASDRLNKLGIKHALITDYVMLLDQTVLAVSAREAEAYLARIADAAEERLQAARRANNAQRRELRKRGADDAEISQVAPAAKAKKVTVDLGSVRGATEAYKKFDVGMVDYVREILDALNERLGHKLALVSEKPVRSKLSKSIFLFWIMPEKHIFALQKAGWKDLIKWDLPW